MKNTATFQRILAQLDAAPVKYKIIFPNGEEVGDLEVVSPRKKRPCAHPYGTISNYLDPLMEDMKVGDIRDIALPLDLENFSLTDLTSNVSARAIKKWGKGSATVCRGDSGVEVMRLK